MGNRKWDEESIKKEALKYKSRSEFIQNNPSAYQTARKQDILDETCSHMEAKSRRFTTDEFIKKAKELHGKKYDYKKVEYKNSLEKIEIICIKHGTFSQRPNAHLQGNCGCPRCNNRSYKFTTKEFIKRAMDTHGNKYDYSSVDYTNANTKVQVICGTHGVFEQSPMNHIRGRGCPICSLIRKKK